MWFITALRAAFKVLGGLGPAWWIGMAFAALMAFAGLQTHRLDSAQRTLKTERAERQAEKAAAAELVRERIQANEKAATEAVAEARARSETLTTTIEAIHRELPKATENLRGVRLSADAVRLLNAARGAVAGQPAAQ